MKNCYRQAVGECSTRDASFWKKLWALELSGKVLFSCGGHVDYVYQLLSK